MKDKRVIKYDRLPTNPGRTLLAAAVIYLLLDRFNSPLWAYIVASICLFILFAYAVAESIIQEECEIEFKEKG